MSFFSHGVARCAGGLVPVVGLLLLAAGCSPDPKPAAALPDDVSVTLADGLALSLWATEPMVVSPVALSVDNQGVVYVTETTRRKTSNLDIRLHRHWMTDDLSFETIEDKRAFLHDRLAPANSAETSTWLEDRNGDGSSDWRDLAVRSEHLHRLVDTDGDGTADAHTVFADSFNTEVTGIGAGVLAYDDAVYFTVAPDLWRLHDADGDGVADERTSLAYGFGVHFGFAGHDMSGLTMGPDGKVYWSIGDIGLSVEGPDGRRWHYPHEGAVMRANPDGSDFEVFAHGLRNPQEIGFDAYGNLFSADNDSDKPGDDERIVHIVEGSDSGWRMYWQFGKYNDPRNSDYNPWLAERYHAPAFEGQAAFLTPPVAYHHAGPAGFAYNPGTALSDRWKDYFFVSQFTGSPSQSRITAFRVEPDGASFTLADDVEVLRGIQATGLNFGPDGALYFADWLEGWDVKDRGRIWKLDTPEASDARRETQRLLAGGAANRSTDDLAELLRHDDMRVRMMAQFELVERDEAGALLDAAQQTDHQLARLHGIWGLGQLGRVDAETLAPILPLLDDGDAVVRAQVAKVIGDARYEAALEPLIAHLDDDNPQVRFYAAEALGKLGDPAAFEPLRAMLEANDDEDAFLRHAGSLALSRLGGADALVALADDSSRAVRLAAVVALRHLQHPGVATFLEDDDELVVTEAARAIHDDASIPEALPALARVLERDGLLNEALLRRALNANLRLGEAEHAERVAEFANRTGAPHAMREEAVTLLGIWSDPPKLDRVEGHYRDLGQRAPAIAQNAAAPHLERWIITGTEGLQIVAAQTAVALQARAVRTALQQVATDPEASADVRSAALDALGTLGDPQLFAAALEQALSDTSTVMRQSALHLVLDSDLPEERVTDLLHAVLENGGVREQQTALAALGRLRTGRARTILAGWMDRLLGGHVAPELHLDLLEAAETQGTAPLQAQLASFEAARPPGDSLAAYLETLHGGRPEVGREIVYEHETAQCMRCHQIDGEGGLVAPDLTGIGDRATRRYLLEALVEPDATIAPGYGSAGTGSAMPPMGLILSKRELRDVIAYLATLRQDEAPEPVATLD